MAPAVSPQMAPLALDLALRLVVMSLPVSWGCLLCFTSKSDRQRLCQLFTGLTRRRDSHCEARLLEAFEGLTHTQINYAERARLHDAFTQIFFTLEEKASAKDNEGPSGPRWDAFSEKYLLEKEEGVLLD